MSDKIITCGSCGQPTEIDNFKQTFQRQVAIQMDLKDFALVTTKLFGYCPFCGTLNELDSFLEMATSLENKLDTKNTSEI